MIVVSLVRYNTGLQVFCSQIPSFNFSGICGGFRGGSFEYAYARVARSVRFDLFSALVQQEVAFYDAHKTGEAEPKGTIY